MIGEALVNSPLCGHNGRSRCTCELF